MDRAHTWLDHSDTTGKQLESQQTRENGANAGEGWLRLLASIFFGLHLIHQTEVADTLPQRSNGRLGLAIPE